MKIFDIHAHIYPDAIADRAVRAMSSGYDNILIRNDGRLSTLIRRMDEAKIDRFAAHSVATTAHQVDAINRFVRGAAKEYPGRLIPFGAIHPDTPDMDSHISGMIASGFRAVKLHPELQGFKVDEPRAVRMFAALAGRLPVLLHCGDYRCDNSTPERIKNMLRETPGLKLVCAHLGGWTTWEIAASELIGADVWVDTSSSLYTLDAPTAVSIIRGYGVDRVLFGSDYPMWHPAEELRRFLALPLTPAEQQKILWSNHLSLLSLSQY